MILWCHDDNDLSAGGKALRSAFVCSPVADLGEGPRGPGPAPPFGGIFANDL